MMRTDGTLTERINVVTCMSGGWGRMRPAERIDEHDDDDDNV